MNRLNDDHKFGTTMALNQTTSAEYGRFALNARRHTSPKTNASRETNITSRRYKPNGEYKESMFRTTVFFIYILILRH